MDSRNYWKTDLESLWHPYTRHSALSQDPFPVISRANGPYLYDTDGARYLDAISSWWSCNLGHSHPRLVAAIKTQAEKLQHSILGNLTHPNAIALASSLSDLCMTSKGRVLFASDGSSAVEAALKVAIQYRHNTGQHERQGFVSLEQAYHGDTIGSMSVGYLPSFHEPFERVLFRVHRAPSPCCAMCSLGMEPATCRAECFEPMEAILDQSSEELTAVIIEPLCQGAAGMRIYSPKYLVRLSEACRQREVLLIADEIAVGMGRTGKMLACQHAGIQPDIVCLGKAISGGTLPISATIVREDIYSTFADGPEDHTFYHGHTFAGNPVACAAALETLAIYDEEKIPQQAADNGLVLKEEMQSLATLPGVSGIRCLGMIAAMEVPDPDRLRRLLLKRHNILIRPLGNTAYLMLPLTVEHDLIRDTVTCVAECLD